MNRFNKFCRKNNLPIILKLEDNWMNNSLFDEEYNIDTSAGHPIQDDDIVRYSFEKRRAKDKEP